MTRRAWLMLGWGVVILVLVDGLMLSFDPQYEPSHASDKNNNDNKRAYGPVISIVLGAIASTERFIEAHEKLLIVLSTIAIAAFTYTLWRATGGLQALAAKQAVDTSVALGIARDSANAATRAADVAEKTLMISQRAYLGAKNYSAKVNKGSDGVIIDWRLTIVFENSGNTPAHKANGGVVLLEVPRDGKSHLTGFDFANKDQPGASTTVGAKHPITVSSGTGKDRLSLEQAKRIHAGEIDVFLCGVVHYRDIFPETPVRRTRVCVKLSVDDPDFTRANPFGFSAYEQYNEAT